MYYQHVLERGSASPGGRDTSGPYAHEWMDVVLEMQCQHRLNDPRDHQDSCLGRRGLHRSLTGLPECRDHAELLQHAQRVEVQPAFHELAVHDAVNTHSRDRHRLACRWSAHALTLMRTPHSPVAGHPD